MKSSILFLLLVTSVLLDSCGNSQTAATKTSLTATEFSKNITSNDAAVIIDVRTPQEFENGHIEYAINYDWNGSEFDKQIATLDKEAPLFVYCLSGGRSSSAASHLRSNGFKEVYELNGGMMQWRAAGLPETTSVNEKPAGMTKKQFSELLNSDKVVLVDFYADWCAPCKKMKPYLDEISKDIADKVIIVRIDADKNQALCQELNITALPVLQLYKANKLEWENIGFIPKEQVLKQLN